MQHNAISAKDFGDLQILIIVALCLLIAPYLAKFLRMSVSAVEIILGAVIAYFGFFGASENFELLANIGFYYLMFIAGMEVNLRDFFSMDKKLVQKSLIYISMLYISSFLIVWAFEIHFIFVLIIPVMSVGLLSMLFKEFGKQCYWLNTSMLVGALAELVSIVALTLAGAFLQTNSSIFEVAQSIFYLAVFLGICLLMFKILGILFWWYPQLRTILIPWEDQHERDIRFCVAIFILIIATMVLSKLEIVLGAFIAGSFITTFFNHKKGLEQKISSFGYGFLIPVFFIYIGSTFDLKMLLEYEILLKALSLMGAMLGLRIICASVFIKEIGLKNTLLFGLSHSMPLTLLIAIATLSYAAKFISAEFYAALILTALFEAIFVMSLIKIISRKKV